MPVASRILTAADAPLAHLARRDRRLAAVIARLKRLSVRGVRSPSRHMIETIVGQMLSSKADAKLQKYTQHIIIVSHIFAKFASALTQNTKSHHGHHPSTGHEIQDFDF